MALSTWTLSLSLSPYIEWVFQSLFLIENSRFWYCFPALNGVWRFQFKSSNEDPLPVWNWCVCPGDQKQCDHAGEGPRFMGDHQRRRHKCLTPETWKWPRISLDLPKTWYDISEAIESKHKSTQHFFRAAQPRGQGENTNTIMLTSNQDTVGHTFAISTQFISVPQKTTLEVCLLITFGNMTWFLFSLSLSLSGLQVWFTCERGQRRETQSKHGSHEQHYVLQIGMQPNSKVQ